MTMARVSLDVISITAGY